MGVENGLLAKELLTKEEFDKFIVDLAKSVDTESKHLDKYNSWHFPFGKRIDIFQKYFGIGGIGLRIENSVELLRDIERKNIIGAVAEAKIINKSGETVANATRLGMKEDWLGKDKFVEKAQQYALETALGYLGIRSSKDDEEGGTPSQTSSTNYQAKASVVSVKPAIAVPVAPIAASKPVVAIPTPVPAVFAKEEKIISKQADGTQQVEFNPPVISNDKGKVTFGGGDKLSVNDIYFKSELPKEVKKKYFAIWTGECGHELLERFISMFKSFEEAYKKEPKQAIQELNVLEGRGKMEVNPYNLNIVQKIIS
jgi:hypothetical protein